MTATLGQMRRAARVAVAAVLLIGALALVHAGSAHAEGYERYCYGKIAGKSYCGGATESTLFHLVAEWEVGGSAAICVAPGQYSGGWKFPYGWVCGNGVAEWSFANIAAHPMLDNPNSPTYTGYGYADFR